MSEYEYTELKVDAGDTVELSELNELGAKGYQLMAMNRCSIYRYVYGKDYNDPIVQFIFMREKKTS